MKKILRKSIIAAGLSIVLMNSAFSAETGVQAIMENYKTQMNHVHRRMPRVEGITDTVLVVGPTGSGKSTFLTWLGGGELTAIDSFGQFILNGSLEAENDIHISHSRTGTHFPTPLCINAIDPIAFWDCPGFGDVGGAEKNLVHMASLIEVLRNCSNVKVLCVLNETRCLNRTNNVIDLFNQLSKLFPNEEQQRRMISLMITGNNGDRDHSFEALSGNYAEDMENGLTPQARSILRYLIDPDNRNRVWKMRKPTVVGAYSLSRESFWQGFNNSHYVNSPQFSVSLLPDSLHYLNDLSNGVNDNIVQLLHGQRESLIQSVVASLTCFEGTRAAFRAHVNALRDVINQLGANADAGENMSLRFARLPGLNHQDIHTLQLQANQIETLKILLGDVTHVNGRQLIVNYAPHRWLNDGLGSIHAALQGAFNALQNPVNPPIRTILAHTFISPNNNGTVREEETFRLPHEAPWNARQIVTLTDIPAIRTRTYAHNDIALASIPRQIYTLQRDGVEPINQETIEIIAEAEPYNQSNVERRIAPGSLNVPNSTVELRITKTYKRPDETLYVQNGALQNYPIRKDLLRYNHEDGALRSTEIVRCTATHEGEVLQLGEQTDRAFDYTPGDIRGRAMVPGTLNLAANNVVLRIRRAYNRPDRTECIKEENVASQSIQRGTERYVADDANLRSARYVMYKTNHGGADVNLEERQDGYVAYTPGNVFKRTVVPSTLDASRNIVELDIKRAYSRPDASIYERDNRVVNAIVPGQERFVVDYENIKFKKFMSYLTIHEGVSIDLGEHEIVITKAQQRKLFIEEVEDLTIISHTLKQSVKAICNNTASTEVYLSDNAIGDEGVKYIAHALTLNTTITGLYMGRNSISNVGCKSLAKALVKNSTLGKLLLDGNPIGDEGCRILGEAIAEKATLTSLDLDNTDLSDVSFNVLSDVLKKNPRLTRLSITSNKFSSQGIHNFYYQHVKGRNVDVIFSRSSGSSNSGCLIS